MKDFKWMNGYTGEVFYTLYDAIKEIFIDAIRNKKCRTVKMFKLVRL